MPVIRTVQLASRDIGNLGPGSYSLCARGIAGWLDQVFLGYVQESQQLLIAQTAFHSFQVRWLLGLSVPYCQILGFDAARSARYDPIRKDTVLLGPPNPPSYRVQLYLRIASRVPAFPLQLTAWMMLSFGNNCEFQELARFRAVVLDLYDTANMKLSEFYAMSVPIFVLRDALWRSSMRCSRTDALEGSPYANLPGRIPDILANNYSSWSAVFNDELLGASLHEPWVVERPNSKKQVARTTDQDTSPPFSEFPFSPYTVDRNRLHAPGAAFWSQFSDWNLLPHLIFFDGAAHLLWLLAQGITISDLHKVSERMSQHYELMWISNVRFWRGIISALTESGIDSTSRWRGPDIGWSP